MNDWLAWGIPIITWLQGLGDWLIQPMKLFTFMGSEEFLMLVMPAILWCVDVSLGFRMGLILVCSDMLNGLFKLAFGWPRPYWVSDRVRALSTETSFGFPSGHSQNALAMWGRLAAAARRRWAHIVLGLLILLVSLSRVHLGVHFPTDVLGGWLLGGLLLWAFLRWEQPARARLAALPVSGQILLAAGLSLGLLALQLAVVALTASRLVPPEWAAQAAAASPGADPIAPRSLEGMFASAGLVLGVGAGGALLFAWRGFNAQGPWAKRGARYVLGLVGVVALWMGLRVILPSGDTALALALRYLRYAAVGFWAVYGAPRTFVWLRLA